MKSTSFVPPLLTEAMDWALAHPVQGAIAVLVCAAVAVWLARKAMKVLMVLIASGIVAILASWFLVGQKETEDAIRHGAGAAVEKGRELLDPDGAEGGS